ncbi:ATP synthase F1 subunit gamma [Lentimicrobium sp.]
MPNLKEIRTRISSVKSTQQITSAMKMVAASKLLARILLIKPSSCNWAANLTNQSGDTKERVYARVGPEEKILLIVFSSNRGLSGAYNSNVIKRTNQLLAEYQEQVNRGTVSMITVGKKVSEYYTRKTNLPVVGSYDHFYDSLSYEAIAETAEGIIHDFVDGKYDKILMVYHQFKNAVVQYLKVEQFLPVVNQVTEEDLKKSDVEYIFDPSREEIMASLIPQILKTQFYKVLSDAWASEQGARMTAMSQATDNATELLKDLKLVYNKARQASITKEILEIVSGAEALKSS